MRTPVHLADRLSDTSPDIEQLRIRVLRKMSPTRKLELIDDAIKTNRQLLWAGLVMRHPEESEARLERRLLSLVLGEDLVFRAFGPLEDSNTDEP